MVVLYIERFQRLSWATNYWNDLRWPSSHHVFNACSLSWMVSFYTYSSSFLIICTYFYYHLLCNVHTCLLVKLCAMAIWNGIFFDKKPNSWFNASNKIYSCSPDRGYCEITSSRLDLSAEKGITYCCVFFLLAEMLIMIFLWYYYWYCFLCVMCMNGWVWVHSSFEVWTLTLGWASISFFVK